MMTAASGISWTQAEVSEVHACLTRILASPVFAQSERQQRFLKFIVTETLSGHTERLKGYTIGVEVFDRDPSFDPTVDAIVRVEAARLRAKLRECYDGEGRTDPVRFDLPKGAYAVGIEWREQESLKASATKWESAGAPTATAAHEAGQGIAASARLRAIEDKPSLAVLPFTNISSDPEQEYFADGITDGLITELSRLSELFVISRHSSFVYKGLSKRAEEIG
ncbi:MAG: hypothetical protein ACT4NU_01325, partial [Chromatiales bacterium]